MIFCSLNYQKITHISPQERGFAYGDGHFTTAKISGGIVEYLDDHIARLKTGNAALMLGEVDWPELTHYMKKTASAYQQAVLKVVITSGEAGRGYARKACSPLNIYVFVFDFPEHYANWRQNGIDSGLARFRLGLNPALAGIKHLNRIEQVMIRQELDSRNEQELIVADINHHIIEASCANVFWLKGSEWMTPDLSNAGVKGILREHILALFPDIKQVSKMSAELHNIRAMFICNAVMGIVPVIRYEEQSLERLPVEAIIERYETYDKH